jgi:hypothetical protein
MDKLNAESEKAKLMAEVISVLEKTYSVKAREIDGNKSYELCIGQDIVINFSIPTMAILDYKGYEFGSDNITTINVWRDVCLTMPEVVRVVNSGEFKEYVYSKGDKEYPGYIEIASDSGTLHLNHNKRPLFTLLHKKHHK